MSPRIADVLRELTGAELRSDVQISDYRKPHNLDLLKHYIFTPKAPAIKKSSVELLHTLCKAFGPGVTENILRSLWPTTSASRSARLSRQPC